MALHGTRSIARMTTRLCVARAHTINMREITWARKVCGKGKGPEVCGCERWFWAVWILFSMHISGPCRTFHGHDGHYDRPSRDLVES